MKNILLLKGWSTYDAGGNYIEEWAAAMRSLGCNTCILDGWSFAMPMQYNHVISAYKFDAVFDCNGNLMAYGIPESLPSDVIYGLYMHDHPGGLERIKKADGRTIVFNCDRRFCDYVDQYLPMIKHREFIPLSGSFYPRVKPYRERSIDVIFTGTYRDPADVRGTILGNLENSSDEEFFKDLMDDILENVQYTFPECLSRVLKKYNRSLSDYEFSEFVRKNFRVDYYACAYYRDKLIRTLLNAGLEIHVFGNRWEMFQSEHSERLVIHKGGAYAARKAVADAKIALNIMPWFKDGFQERIATAMLSEVVAATDESIYTNLNFEDGKDLLIYSLKDMHSLAERIKYLLAHPKEAEEIATNGYRKAQSHTWYHRVRDMLRKMEEEFGVPFIQEGEGRELELDKPYPNKRLMELDAIYYLKKMADFVDHDIGEIELLSSTDLKFLRNKFTRFRSQFNDLLDGMEMNPHVWDFLYTNGEVIPRHVVELFSMQCKALMSRLLLNVNGTKL